MKEQDNRDRLRAIVREFCEDRDTVQTEKATESIVENILTDGKFAKAVLLESLRPLVADMVRREMRSTRGEAVVLGEEVVSREEFDKRAGILSRRFERWMEHANGRYVRFMRMDRDDLLDAATERERHAETMLKVAVFERKLAASLREGQTVGDRYTPEQLDDIWSDVTEEEAA